MECLSSAMIEKAKEAKNVEELLALANENGWEMTEESARAYFAQLSPKNGELADDELDDVSGGGCYSGDRLVVTVGHSCELWTCKKCGVGAHGAVTEHLCKEGFRCNGESSLIVCNECKDISYENGLWLCNHPDKRK